MALAGAVFLVVLYLLGFHSDPAKLKAAQLIGTIGTLGIVITCITLGIKARRAGMPRTEEFTYGQAFTSGFMIALFSALFGIVTSFLYAKFINPDFVDVIVQAQVTQFEAKGMSASQIEAAEKMVRTMSSPGVQAGFGFVFNLVCATIISLIAAAFLKRAAAIEDPEAPPALG